jgi:hypothetical protein
MSQLNEAIARYHKILESEPYRDLLWVKDLQEKMEADQLSLGGRLLCPFLRPNFVTQKQYDALVKAGEALLSANFRMQQLALNSPRLLAKLELLPAEKMLAAIDPGYNIPEVSSNLDLHFSNGSLQVTQYRGNAPTGVAWAENLAEIFYDSPPVKEFRRKYNLTRVGGKQPFMNALLEAYNQFTAHRLQTSSNGNGFHANGNGKRARLPNIAFMEFRQTSRKSEFEIFREYFRSEGFQAEIISPEQVEYRQGKLTSGRFEIDLVYRRFTVQEFLQRFDLTHPLVRAYRDLKVCVINNFRSEMAHKRTMLALLTDESLTAKFPLNERKAVRDHVPWTRLLIAGKTTRGGEQIELLDYVRGHRETLALKPNNETSDEHISIGRDLDQTSWELAVRQSLRSPYVVQEHIVDQERMLFPLMSYGHLEFEEMTVGVHPQAFLGKVSGCSSWLSSAGGRGFSTSGGITPTFIIDTKGDKV